MGTRRIKVAPKATAADLKEAEKLYKRIAALHEKIRSDDVRNDQSVHYALDAYWAFNKLISEMKRPSEYTLDDSVSVYVLRRKHKTKSQRGIYAE